MDRFEQWKEYVEEHKSPHVQSSKNKGLYGWVWYQRNNRDKLSATKVELLNKAGFVWHCQNSLNKADSMCHFEDSTPTEIPYKWMKRFEQWRECFKEHRTPHVQALKTQGLYKWVRNQRNNRDKLSTTQVELLNMAGFLWQYEHSTPTEFPNGWITWFEEWKEYYWEHKTPHVSRAKIQPLSRWVYYQRRNRDKLSAMQVEQLNSFGFMWNYEVKKKDTWMDRFEQWKEYVEEHKTPHVSRGKNSPLHLWVFKQRKYRDNLSAMQVEILNEAGFVWDALPRWAYSFEACIQNLNEHNTSIVDKSRK